MKKLLLWFILVSCSQLDHSPINIEQPPPQISKDWNIKEAVNIAQNAIYEFLDSESYTRSSLYSHRIASASNISFYTSPATKGNSITDTLMYIVNFENNAGFAIVGKKRTSPELIAIIESGNYDGSKTANTGFNLYMEEIAHHLQNMNANQNTFPPEVGIEAWEYKSEITENTNKTNGPLTNVNWHQGAPFNKFCPPDCPTGCVATAIAMAMAALKYPSFIDLTFPNAPSAQTYLSWDSMILPMHNILHDNNCQICDQNALLQREIGHRTNMNYRPRGSETITGKYAGKCLSSFGIHCDIYKQYDINEIFQSISKKYPVIIRAENGIYGHAWIIDGTRYQNKRIDTYRRDTHINGPWTHCQYEIERLRYLHMNYGWNDGTTGYYLAEKYIKAKGVQIINNEIDSYDVKMFTGADGCDKNVHIIPDIHIGI